MTLEEELKPHREWYAYELSRLEDRWALELSRKVARIARAIHPLPINQWWIDRLKTEHEPLTVEHNMRVWDLYDEFMRRTKDIWEKHGERVC